MARLSASSITAYFVGLFGLHNDKRSKNVGCMAVCSQRIAGRSCQDNLSTQVPFYSVGLLALPLNI